MRTRELPEVERIDRQGQFAARHRSRPASRPNGAGRRSGAAAGCPDRQRERSGRRRRRSGPDRPAVPVRDPARPSRRSHRQSSRRMQHDSQGLHGIRSPRSARRGGRGAGIGHGAIGADHSLGTFPQAWGWRQAVRPAPVDRTDGQSALRQRSDSDIVDQAHAIQPCRGEHPDGARGVGHGTQRFGVAQVDVFTLSKPSAMTARAARSVT